MNINKMLMNAKIEAIKALVEQGANVDVIMVELNALKELIRIQQFK